MSPWENIELVTPKTRGFVYLIVNTQDNKLYVGKKKTISERRITVEGRTNKRRLTTPSNWKAYYGSCTELTADILKLGKDKFRRIILGAYDELHTVNYGEAELQFLFQVLDANGSFKWYNKNIKITTMREPADRQYVERLNNILKELQHE